VKVFAAGTLGSATIMALPVAAASAQTAAPQAPVLTSATAVQLSVPARGTAPAQVNSWWQGLTPGQQQQVTDSNPAAIGSLNGIPAAARDYANRQVLSNLTDPAQANSLPNQISSITSQRDNLQSQLNDLPNNSTPGAATGHAALALQSQINNLNDQLDSLQTQMGGLQALQTQIAPGANNPQVPFPASDAPAQQPGGAPQKFLLGVDAPGAASVGSPNVGQFIVAVGNPDTAQNVATVVTGMNSKLDDEFVNYYVGAASNLQGQATVAAPGQTTSVITWYGYNAPQSVGNASWTAPAVAGAPALQQFQAGLYATNADGSNLNSTVIGHSYGSVVLGQASQLPGGLDANQVAVVGSPGMNVPTANAVAGGLNAVGPAGLPQVFAGKNTTDIISLAPGMGATGWQVAGDTLGHGTDPTKPDFGAIVFDTGKGQPGSILNFSTGDFLTYSRAAHSEYFDWGNPALANLGNIVTGNFGAVTSQGTAAFEHDLATGKYSGILPPSLANEFGIPLPDTTDRAPLPGGTGIDGITSWPTQPVNPPPAAPGTGTPANGAPVPGDTGIDGITSWPMQPVNAPPAAPSTAPGGSQQVPAPAAGTGTDTTGTATTTTAAGAGGFTSTSSSTGTDPGQSSPIQTTSTPTSAPVPGSPVIASSPNPAIPAPAPVPTQVVSTPAPVSTQVASAPAAISTPMPTVIASNGGGFSIG